MDMQRIPWGKIEVRAVVDVSSELTLRMFAKMDGKSVEEEIEDAIEHYIHYRNSSIIYTAESSVQA